MARRTSQGKLRRRFVPAEVALAVFADAPRIDAERLRDDVAALLDQDATRVRETHCVDRLREIVSVAPA